MRKPVGQPSLPRAALALGVARDRALRAVRELEGAGPVTVEAVSEVVGGHPNAARRLLEALAEDALVSVGVLRGGRGRPRRTYTVTAAGHAALGDEASEHRELIAAFATHVGRDRPEEAATIGRLWGRQRAARTPASADRTQTVISLLGRLGFDPVEASDPVDSAETTEVVLRTCPLLGLTDDTAFMCRLHEGFLDGLTEHWDAAGAAPQLELAPFAHADGCVVRTRVRAKAAADRAPGSAGAA